MVFREVSNIFEDFQLFSMKEQKVLRPEVDTMDGSKIWKNPNLGIVKAIWDASINLRAGVIGFVCVFRNDEELVMGTKCCAYKVEADPLLAEVMVAYLAITFVRKWVLLILSVKVILYRRFKEFVIQDLLMFGLGILWRQLDMLHWAYPLVIGSIVVEKLMLLPMF